MPAVCSPSEGGGKRSLTGAVGILSGEPSKLRDVVDSKSETNNCDWCYIYRNCITILFLVLSRKIYQMNDE